MRAVHASFCVFVSLSLISIAAGAQQVGRSNIPQPKPNPPPLVHKPLANIKPGMYQHRPGYHAPQYPWQRRRTGYIPKMAVSPGPEVRYSATQASKALYYNQRRWDYGPVYYSAYRSTSTWHEGFWSIYAGSWQASIAPTPWISDPWYQSYWGWYWQPFPKYASYSQWLTDYVMAQSLAEAYERWIAVGRIDNPVSEGTPITEALHQDLNDQLNQTVDAIMTNEPLDLQNTLTNPSYLYTVNETLFLQGQRTQDLCKLTEGDLLRIVNPPVDNIAATVSVVSSKYGECQARKELYITVVQIQNMLNAFTEKVDEGLQQLDSRRDTGPELKPQRK